MKPGNQSSILSSNTGPGLRSNTGPTRSWRRDQLEGQGRRLPAETSGQAISKIIAATLLIAITTTSANATQIVDGNYLRYADSEYENMFFPCQSTEVWSLEGGSAFDALVDYYRNSRTVSSSEIRTSLMLNVLPVDKTEHPGSHIDAVAQVIAILSISENATEVTACRQATR